MTGLRGHVEDVVVDEAARGRGIARLLLERMTQLAQERGLRTLDLTSRPSRESALRLYESVGFRRRETNVLRFTPATD
ncbi:GNAT family N-acetyltransferase [Microbacterium sp. STF-2]|uniref:GNAT family N-acetyltransferase n=1 Tax=Microbacterium sp. STF-2 TaxID=3031132 RepID=UPI002AFDDE94|nr:GNAT family N-acetyltransferase [Microbacterium sp. STF-2]MEA1264070.1 GNAT family N-acetyltransferase [Microbacterium sp. STF-2]